jgi:hypothetical protein
MQPNLHAEFSIVPQSYWSSQFDMQKPIGSWGLTPDAAARRLRPT